MSNPRATLLCLIAFFAVQTLAAQTSPAAGVKVTSPNGEITVLLFDAGTPSGSPMRGRPQATDDLRYAVEFHGKRLMESARLGLELVGQPALGPGMHLKATQPESVDETYSIPVGKTSSVRDHYNGVRADFEDASGRKLTVEVRAFDDGVGFRYLVPEQPALKDVRIANEMTEFAYAKDAETYPLVMNGYSGYEDSYQLREVSGLHSDWIIGLPFLANEPGLGWVAITEADIDNYSGMYLRKDKRFNSLLVKAGLSPHTDAAGVAETGVAVVTSTPFNSPWRVLMIGDTAAKADRVEHRSQSESAVEDCRYFVDQGGQVGMGLVVGRSCPERDLQDRHEHGDDEALYRLRFGFGIRLHADRCGLGKGEPHGPEDYAALADITQVTPEIDMPELIRYANEKHVKLWLWSHWRSVDKYMDQAFPLFEKWGIAGVKIDFMDRDDQWMVGFYRRVVENAAAHHLMIDFHGAFKPDGLRRTYPNLIDARRRDGQGISEDERADHSGAQRDPALYAHAGRPDGLHAGRLRQQQSRELCCAEFHADGFGNAGAGAGSLRRAGEPAADGF